MKSKRSRRSRMVLLRFVVACTTVLPLANAQQDDTAPHAQAEPAGPLEQIQVPEGFVVEPVAGAPLVRYPMLGGFDELGRLFVCENAGVNMNKQELLANVPNSIVLLEDRDRDGDFDQRTVFADRMTFPQGILCYRGSLYVASPPSIWKLTDTDGDNVADVREEIVTGFNFLGHAGSIHGPFLGPEGRIYWCDAPLGHEIRDPRGRLVSQGTAARIFSCRTDGSDVQSYCGGGMFNPVEIAFTEQGDMLGVMTWYNPDRDRYDALVHYVYGGVYPRNVPKWVQEFKQTGPLMPALIRYGVVAPAGIMRYRSTQFGPSFRDTLLVPFFNTHKVSQILLQRVGATFHATEQDFLTSSNPDFRPCDVIEDADGSVLLIDTGGWFVNGCPTSKIGKPEVRGAIYRIRKQRGASVVDPRGLTIAWNSAEIGELTRFLGDDRPAVVDRAVDTLAMRGDAAIPALSSVLISGSERERLTAVWTLSRIGSAAALSGLRGALSDPSSGVRLATVRCLGTMLDAQALAQLKRMVVEDRPEIRREAAAALGRIGQREAVAPLLSSLQETTDRYLEHAILFALIEINDRQATMPGLHDPMPDVRRGALIALDQMDDGQLTKDDVVPLMDTDDVALQNAALDVISRREGWSDQILAVLEAWLHEPDPSDARVKMLRGALVGLGKEPQIQSLIADALLSGRTPVVTQIMLLQVMRRVASQEHQPVYRKAILHALGAKDDFMVNAAIAIASEMGSPDYTPRLREIVASGNQRIATRVAALHALTRSGAAVDAAEFSLLVEQLGDQNAPVDRLAAAEVLGDARLTTSQLSQLVELIQYAGPLELLSLLQPFRHHTHPDIGSRLVRGLTASPGRQAVSPAALQDILQNYPPRVRQAAGELLKRPEVQLADQIARLDSLKATLIGGDVARGRQVFFGRRAACYACHRIGQDGGTVGPQLTGIGEVRTRRDLLEAIVFPSATLARGFQTYLVNTSEGRVHTGLISRQSADAIYLRTAQRTEVPLARDDLEQIVPSPVSIMPEGLDKMLSVDELRDLLAFLKDAN